MILKINGQNFEFCHVNLEKKKTGTEIYCTVLLPVSLQSPPVPPHPLPVCTTVDAPYPSLCCGKCRVPRYFKAKHKSNA